MKLAPIPFLISLLLLPTTAGAQPAPAGVPAPADPTETTTPEKPRPKDPFLPAAPAGKADPFAGEAAPNGPRQASKAPAWTGPRNLVWVNALGAGFGNYALEYQRVLHPRLSLVLSPSLRTLSREVIPGRDVTITGLNVQAGVAVYLPWQAPRGLNVSLTGGFVRLEGKDRFSRTTSTWSVKATIGYRHVFPFGLCLELDVGYFHLPETTLGPLSHETSTVINGGPVVEVGLGWAF